MTNLATSPSAPPRSGRTSTGCHGLTLIELGFVIIILAVIVAVALGFYNTLSRNKEITDVVTDVANIRQAISSYAGGLPLTGAIGEDLAGEDVQRKPLNWNALASLLPGRLGTKAGSTDGAGLIISNANAWQSSYQIQTGVDGNPYYWNLIVTNIPVDLAERVKEKLANSGRAVPTDQTTGNTATLTIPFRVGA